LRKDVSLRVRNTFIEVEVPGDELFAGCAALQVRRNASWHALLSPESEMLGMDASSAKPAHRQVLPMEAMMGSAQRCGSEDGTTSNASTCTPSSTTSALDLGGGGSRRHVHPRIFRSLQRKKRLAAAAAAAEAERQVEMHAVL